jgi:hypothetical protein
MATIIMYVPLMPLHLIFTSSALTPCEGVESVKSLKLIRPLAFLVTGSSFHKAIAGITATD